MYTSTHTITYLSRVKRAYRAKSSGWLVCSAADHNEHDVASWEPGASAAASGCLSSISVKQQQLTTSSVVAAGTLTGRQGMEEATNECGRDWQARHKASGVSLTYHFHPEQSSASHGLGGYQKGPRSSASRQSCVTRRPAGVSSVVHLVICR
jgi:hypothetical protein